MMDPGGRTDYQSRSLQSAISTMLFRLLVGVVDRCRRHALAVLIAGLAVAGLSGWYAAGHMGVSTDTDLLFSAELSWRKQAIDHARDFPQFHDLIVAVVDARLPEEADATAAALAKAAAADPRHFRSVRRPDASPFFDKYGLLLLDPDRLTTLMDQTIDAQPFLGQLVADPSARGLFSALALLGMGVTKEDANLGPYLTPLRGFHDTLREILAGRPQPLSWQTLLGGETADLAGRHRFVLLQPRLDHGMLEPGGEATAQLRRMISELEFVKAGTARVRITGQIPMSDEEFATVAEGAVAGMVISTVLVTLCLFLAVWSWRLIIPILATLALGLVLTLLFASVAVGTLNLISVGFGVLFVGLAVDFAIQFSVRFREYRLISGDPATAMALTARLAGPQILFAALATAAGFLAFLPTDFAGVAELGLIAGAGMIIAFICSMTFLPAVITLLRPRGEQQEVGFTWAAPLDPLLARARWPILGVSVALVVAGALLLPRLAFDADPLNTKNPDTEAVSTLRELIESPLTNPYTIDIMARDEAEVAALTQRLKALPTVSGVLSLLSFVPADQQDKLAVIADANTILAPTLGARESAAPVTPDEIRLAAETALAQIEPALSKLPADHPLADIARDLKALGSAPDPVLIAANAALTRFLPDQLDRLRLALSAEPITRDILPPALVRDWIAPDGRLRMQVNATDETLARGAITAFATEVRAVAPQAGGPAITIAATSRTIIEAFRTAALYALLVIAVILAVALRRVLDVALVMAPLLLAALLTLLVVVLIGMPLNFANIIALPLLLGVGVSYNVYFVMNWRAGLTNPLGSATMRAVVFSALTTATAFGALALSRHPGTASMGLLLLISLGCTLVASLVFLPAMLATMRRPGGG
jgi:hopanoid biosynthesis associated RND transporter like protein HpnN